MARITELAVAAVAVLTTAAGTDATVSRVYVPDIDSDALVLNERLVQVFAPGYANEGNATRGEKITSYSLRVVIVEKYTGAGSPPLEWIDDRVEWVKVNVVDLLTDARVRLSVTAYCDSDSVEAFDEDELTERKVFWSTVMMILKE